MNGYPDYIIIPSFELLSSPQVVPSSVRQEAIDFMINWHWANVRRWEENVLIPCINNTISNKP